MERQQRMYWNDKPYHSLDYALKKKYGEKVYKIALDAGMTCPNRDGTCGRRGCIFCSEGGSGEFAASGDSISSQLARGRASFHGKSVGNKFIAYFQAYTNTYAPVDRLASLYSAALNDPAIVGISIATRPDCIGSEVCVLLHELQLNYPDKFIWIELGLQTMHEHSAILIRRGYTLSVFETAVRNLQKLSIPVITHVILGLPGEDKQAMLETCHYLAAMRIDGIKLQLLHVLKNTDLVELYHKKTFEILTFMEYIDIVISCLEILPPDMVIHRVTGDGPKSLLIAPRWSLDKRRVLNTLHQEMRRRGSFQGKLFKLT